MKVHFNSSKELHPDRDNGQQVVYGPGKRMGYKVRWYLIVALVSSPLVWLMVRLLNGWVIQDAPAQVVLNTQELRAIESGRVEELPVQVGRKVAKGEILIRLDNPDWRLRNRMLQTQVKADHTRPNASTIQAARLLQSKAVALQNRTVNLFRNLERRGGLASAEVLQAESKLNQERLAQHALERQIEQERYQQLGTPFENERADQERRWLGQRLQRLTHTAQSAGRVMEILVSKGENVGPGTVLMRVERPDQPLLWIYLQPHKSARAWPGRRVQVSMPDGSWRPAEILGQADLARRMPAGLLSSSDDNGLSLRVPARFIDPLPPRWRVDQLPLTVRFTGLFGLPFG
jgi:multidrug efflux pump subunit AcrA (membrane-fusion protein)